MVLYCKPLFSELCYNMGGLCLPNRVLQIMQDIANMNIASLSKSQTFFLHGTRED